MDMYKLTIDGVTKYVRSNQKKLDAAMWEHIRRERKAGRSLDSIQFSYCPLNVRVLDECVHPQRILPETESILNTLIYL